MLNEEIFSEMELSLLTNPSAPLYQEYLWSFFELSYFKICTGSFWRYVAHFLLFNCKGWSADRKEPFIQKRHTLYLPVILIGGPICRHMLLFYVKLCHRTHLFQFHYFWNFVWPCLCRISSLPDLSFTFRFGFLWEQKTQSAYFGSGLFVSFSFSFEFFLNSGYIIPWVFSNVKRFFKKISIFFA